MKFGLVGLPNVGKSSIFNIIAKKPDLAEAKNFPFCTINPNETIAFLDDPKITTLATISKTENIVLPRLECVDIAGLVEGASQGEGLGNQFLSHIRQVDLILHVIRCFDDPDVIHVRNKVDPVSDANLINLELILSDFDICTKILANRKSLILYTKRQIDVLQQCLKILGEDEQLIRKHIDIFSEDDIKFINERGLITAKPMIYVANINDAVDQDMLEGVEKALGSKILTINASEVNPDDNTQINAIIKRSYDELGLITFYTTGKKETRGWTIKRGTKAKQAAGVIHSDFEKKFIRASIIKYDDFIAGNTNPKVEGANYVMHDTDVVEFHVGR